jgi:hypothetical protein
MLKLCRRCFEEKELDHFYKTNNKKTYKDGTINWCKECVVGYQCKRKKNIRLNKIEYKPIVKTIIADDPPPKPDFYIDQGNFIISFD